MTLYKFARYLRIDIRTARRWARTGIIKAKKRAGYNWIVDDTAVTKLVLNER